MPTRHRGRSAAYEVLDEHLVRTVSFPNREGYVHRCPLAAYETVAHAIEETPSEGNGTSLTEIAKAEDLPITAVNVPLEFLKQRGLVEVRGRRCYPGSGEVYL